MKTLYGDVLMASNAPKGNPTGLITGQWWTKDETGTGKIHATFGIKPRYYLLQWQSGASDVVENGEECCIGTEWLQGYSYYDTKEQRDELFDKMVEQHTFGIGVAKSTTGE